MFWSAWGLSLFFVIVIVCFDKIRRQSPHNYILLFSFVRLRFVAWADACVCEWGRFADAH